MKPILFIALETTQTKEEANLIVDFISKWPHKLNGFMEVAE